MILYQALGCSGGSKSNSSSIRISGWIVISRNQATAKRLQRYVPDPEYQLCDSSFVCDGHSTTCLGGNVHPMTRITGLAQNRNTRVHGQDIQCSNNFRLCQKFIPTTGHEHQITIAPLTMVDGNDENDENMFMWPCCVSKLRHHVQGCFDCP